MTMTLLCLALLSASPEVSEKTSAPGEEPLWALQLRMTTPSMVAVGGSLGGLSFLSQGQVGLGAGLLLERAVARHWTVHLGIDGASARSSGPLSMESYNVSLNPGVRWYAARAFDGGWIGLQVPLLYGWNTLSSTATVDASSRTLAGSLDLLFGWAFRWENRLVLSLAVGPTASLARVWIASNAPIGSASIGVRGVLAVGLVL